MFLIMGLIRLFVTGLFSAKVIFNLLAAVKPISYTYSKIKPSGT